MKIAQSYWTAKAGWRTLDAGIPESDLVFYFYAPGLFETKTLWQDLRARYPSGHLVGCSTGGEILDRDVLDDALVVTAVRFEQSQVKTAMVTLGPGEDARDAGRRLAEKLPTAGLRAVFVLSDGIHVNGTALVRGLIDCLGEGVTITGGLAGDGANFRSTAVGCDALPVSGQIVAVGLYGTALSVSHGSVGGWDCFGPKRRVTRSAGNVLYELDGEPALDLYRRYLGEEAERLPGSALLFPLSIIAPEDPDSDVVRTVVGVDDQAKSMIFAGDIPEGASAQLMRGHFDRLIDGSARAADAAKVSGGDLPRLALLVSCIGRKLLLGERIGEEVEAVADSLGEGTKLVGFYSYGEISPHATSGRCELHNQTMTVTVLSED